MRYDEGLEVGYRWYGTHSIRPLYPFGFGLSYADFSFSDGAVQRRADGSWEASAVVRNTSNRPGVAVAQLYLTFPSHAGEPRRQLQGFERVSLAGKAQARLRFRLPATAFRTWNTDRAEWGDVAGKFTAEIGSSVETLPVRTIFYRMDTSNTNAR